MKKSVKEIVMGILEKTREISKGLQQTDDITILILKFVGES